jgi:plasmid replication initiation protein
VRFSSSCLERHSSRRAELMNRNTTPADQLSMPGIDSPLLGQVKNDRHVMAYNFFPLSKEAKPHPIRYDDGKVAIEVRGEDIATIYDKEILIYVVSLMSQRVERGEDVGRQFSFTAGDFFRVAGLSDGSGSYERIEGALGRIQGTQIRTNIVTGGERTREWFSWLDSAKVTYRKRKDKDGEMVERMEKITVTLCEWLWRAIKIDDAKFVYDPKFFELRPLEKRLYEIARAHCGRGGFRMWLDKLQVRVGSEDTQRKFRMNLKQIADRKRPLPGYAFTLIDRQVLNTAPRRGRPAKRTMVVFYRQDASIMETLNNADTLDLVE